MKTTNLTQWSLSARRMLIVVQLATLFVAFWLSKFSQSVSDGLTISAVALVLVSAALFLFTVYGGRDMDPLRFNAQKIDEWQLQYRNKVISSSFAIFSTALVVIALSFYFLPDTLVWIPQTKQQMASLIIIVWSFMFAVPLWISMWIYPELEGE